MNDGKKHSGKCSAFISGVILGGILGATAVSFSASPTGRKCFRQLKQDSIPLKAKGVDLVRSAREKTLAIGQTLSLKRKSQTASEEDRMIPIPKDYV